MGHKSNDFYLKLQEFTTTEYQREVLQAIIDTGSQSKAAIKLGRNRRSVERLVLSVKVNAARMGYCPDSDLDTPQAPGLPIQGTSTLYDGEGKPIMQWIKTKHEKQEQQIQDFIDDLEGTLKTYKPIKKTPAPKQCEKDLLNVVPIGDAHIGMYSWVKETGNDFDCDIAEKHLREATLNLMEKLPPAETCLILNLGDFFHSDNQSNRTARAGNALDVDTRWSRVLQIGISIMIDCVEIALRKHKKVIVKNNIGNHDDHTSQVLAICLAQTFRNNPRVTIAEPQEAFFCMEFGKNMIMSTHGHMVRPKEMAKVAANYYPKEWGNTEHRYCYLGHFHHEERIEDGGLVIEIFNTLAAQDAWHHASGYKSKRNLKAIVLHKEYGETERYTYGLNR